MSIETKENSASPGPQRLSHPNVVIVICDDIGYGDLGCYGASMIATPRLDELAAAGVRMTAMYGGGPTCSPARAALLTGRVAPRTGAGRVSFPGGRMGLDKGEKTIAMYLSEAGYASGCFGKWHLGDLPDNGPRAFGFEEYFGMPFSNDTEPLRVYRNEELIEEPGDVASLSRRYTSSAIDFIRSVADKQPFFTYVAFTMPHYPVTPEPAFEGKSEAGPYGDVVEAIDHYVGELRDAIREAGALDNTIFVFTSDHGPWFEGSTGGLRGRKFETWDGGVRVPFIISWPARLAAGTVIDSPAATVDVLPTLCEVADIAPSQQLPFDGEPILDLLEARDASEHGPIWFFDAYELNAVRYGRWKLHRRRQTWGDYPFSEWSMPQLFDVSRDPQESYDLSKREPDVVRQLALLMESFAATLGPPRDGMDAGLTARSLRGSGSKA